MRRRRRALILVLLIAGAGIALALAAGRDAVRVAVGYSAKQMCSGVFVGGLPAAFVLETDIRPRMAILGPLLPMLDVRAERGGGLARAHLLGVSARAVHRSQRGCALGSSGRGDPPMMPAAAPEPAGVPEPLAGPVREAFAEPADGGRNTLALLLSHRGRLLVERYATPVTATTPMQGWSMNKSLMATWVGLQAARDVLDPARPLRALLPDEPIVAALDERLTLLHLLQMESGLDFEEVYGPGSDVTRMLYLSPAMWQVPATAEQAFAPGERFAYSSGDTVLASLFWQRSLDGPYERWIRDNFQVPLGLTTLVAEADASGVQVGSSYVYLTPRDWLRVGQLWLDAWHGRSKMLPGDWLRESVAPRASDPRGRYGREIGRAHV